MAGLIDTEEQAILNLFLRATAWTLPTDWFIGLSTTTPTDAGANFTEPIGNAYARVTMTRNATNWAAASGTAPAVGDNAVAVTFPQATGSWGTVTHFGLFDAATAGNLKAWGALATSKAVGANDTPSFAIGALDVQVGDPGDTF